MSDREKDVGEEPIGGTPPGGAPPTDGPSEMPACLVVLTGVQLGVRFDMVSPMSLGAGDSCEVELLDAARSGRLAVLSRGSCWEIRRVGGAEVYLNDEVVEESALGHGDRLRVGDVELKVLISETLERDYHEEIYRLVTHDNLTDAFNRRYLLETLEPLMSRSRRWQAQLSLVVVRLEGLDSFREKKGEAAMAQALRRLARVLIELSRSDDVVARVADDEFAIMLYHTPGEGADRVANRVGQIPTGVDLRLVVGVSTLDHTMSTAQALLDAACAASRDC